MEHMLPNFLVIGPGKSGTTWIYHALKDHPQVCVSSAKETLFFESEFYRGLEWYSSFFSQCDDTTEAIGEVSNTYIYAEKAPERIKSINPDMKIISCLRNPVERTFSHYLFLVRGGQFSGTFREALEEYPDLIERAKYYKHLKPYFDHFEDEHIYIALFDRLKNDNIGFISKIYKFLGVDSEYRPNVDEKYRLVAAEPRNRLLALMAKKGAQLMRRWGRPDIVSSIKFSFFPKLLYREYDKEEKPAIDDKDRAYLVEKIRPDTRQLAEKMNLNLEQMWFT